jgi:hypothetical protein
MKEEFDLASDRTWILADVLQSIITLSVIEQWRAPAIVQVHFGTVFVTTTVVRLSKSPNG